MGSLKKYSVPTDGQYSTDLDIIMRQWATFSDFRRNLDCFCLELNREQIEQVKRRENTVSSSGMTRINGLLIAHLICSGHTFKDTLRIT